MNVSDDGSLSSMEFCTSIKRLVGVLFKAKVVCGEKCGKWKLGGRAGKIKGQGASLEIRSQNCGTNK